MQLYIYIYIWGYIWGYGHPPPLPRTDKPRPLNRPRAIPACCAGSGFKPSFRRGSIPKKTKARQTKRRSTETPPTFACFCWSVFGRLQPPSLGAENGKSREYAGIVLFFWVCAPGAVQNWHYIGKPPAKPKPKTKQFRHSHLWIVGLIRHL